MTACAHSSAQLASFCAHASAGVSVVEGNRGLYDGLDVQGTHSTASLARLLRAPVVLVVSAAKVTRTVAAVVLGCRELEQGVDLAGVILNHVAGARHEALTRQAVEQLTGVPVLGALPRLRDQLLPGRHLGLVPPQEHAAAAEAAATLGPLLDRHVDLGRLLQIARGAPPLPASPAAGPAPAGAGGRARVGVFQDAAFTFYYPENLEALARAGAQLVPVSGLADAGLPEGLGALVIGGGFPETHAARLSANAGMRAALRRAAEAGMPIYAECGGLIYLSRSLRLRGEIYPMAGVLDLELALDERPAGHGYVALEVTGDNPFFPLGLQLRGHEFHYSRVVGGGPLRTAFSLSRGAGCGEGRDGIVFKNVLAGYTHLHALGAPQWAPAVVAAAERFGGRRV